MQNVKALAGRLTDPWKPTIVAEVGGYLMKVVMLHGTFPWHMHEAEDELFYCIQGEFHIEQEWAPNVLLREGDVVTIPAGRRHRPVAEEPALAILFEKAEIKQYGD